MTRKKGSHNSHIKGLIPGNYLIIKFSDLQNNTSVCKDKQKKYMISLFDHRIKFLTLHNTILVNVHEIEFYLQVLTQVL